ncbi:hypothetical protein T439DRAFT_324539 [Meredithblackwellia eburnea MCA 4105]
MGNNSNQPIEIQSGITINNISTISILPCEIKHNGQANINQFFIQRQSNGQLEATFRGRLLLSHQLEIPNGYKGIILNNSKQPEITLRQPAIRLQQQPPPTPSKRPLKKLKLDNNKQLINAPQGSRRSPRRKAAIAAAQNQEKRYSLDSDDEDDQGQGDPPPTEPSEIGITPTCSSPSSLVFSIDQQQQQQLTPSSSTSLVPLAASSASLTLIEADMPPTPISEVGPTGSSTIFSSTLNLEEEEEQEEQDRGRPAVEDDSATLLSEKDVQLLEPKAQFDKILVWHADFPLDPQDDPYVRTVTEWFSIAEKIHSY